MHEILGVTSKNLFCAEVYMIAIRRLKQQHLYSCTDDDKLCFALENPPCALFQRNQQPAFSFEIDTY